MVAVDALPVNGPTNDAAVIVPIPGRFVTVAPKATPVDPIEMIAFGPLIVPAT